MNCATLRVSTFYLRLPAHDGNVRAMGREAYFTL